MVKNPPLTSRENQRIRARYRALASRLGKLESLSQGSVMPQPPRAWRWTRKVRGKTVTNFSCDASKIAATGVPCLVVGPGDIAHAHTATESIAVEELLQGVEAYTKIAEALLPV